jgi:hypothetical protein
MQDFGAPRPSRNRHQGEWPKYHHRDRPPVEPLATHDNCRRHDRSEAVADEQNPAASVERLRTAADLPHQSLVEIRRQVGDRRGHRTPQQIIDPSFARFHLTHKSILSLSAFHEAADARDADTIWRCSREPQAIPPLPRRPRPANSTVVRPIDKPRVAFACTRQGPDRAARFSLPVRSRPRTHRLIKGLLVHVRASEANPSLQGYRLVESDPVDPGTEFGLAAK